MENYTKALKNQTNIKAMISFLMTDSSFLQNSRALAASYQSTVIEKHDMNFVLIPCCVCCTNDSSYAYKGFMYFKCVVKQVNSVLIKDFITDINYFDRSYKRLCTID